MTPQTQWLRVLKEDLELPVTIASRAAWRRCFFGWISKIEQAFGA